jgi:hypothetical protein
MNHGCQTLMIDGIAAIRAGETPQALFFSG